MGCKSEYICTECGYSAIVSGQKDYGFYAVEETRICNNCNELVDVLLEMNLMKPSKNIGKCPVCKRKKNHVLWDSQIKPCPKCGKSMELGQTTIMWD